MYFNQMWGNPSPWASPFWGAPVGGYGATNFPCWNFGYGFGNQMGLANWLSGALMRHFGDGLDNCWGSQYRRGPRRHCRHDDARGAAPPAPAAAVPAAPAPAAAAPAGAAPAAAAPAAPAPASVVNAPKQGAWDANRGGYIVGRSGQLQIDTLAPHYPQTSEDYQIQYRSAGGEWTTLGTANGLHGKSVTVKADPGSKIEFRMNAYGTWQQAGTTLNTSGRDMAKVTQDGDGYKLGFENYKTGTDYADLFLKLSDPTAPR